MDSAIVTRDPEIMSGALSLAGTRVPVKNLFDYLEGPSSLEEFLEDFPSVSRTLAQGTSIAPGVHGSSGRLVRRQEWEAVGARSR